jgi:hypothetical protein
VSPVDWLLVFLVCVFSAGFGLALLVVAVGSRDVLGVVACAWFVFIVSGVAVHAFQGCEART